MSFQKEKNEVEGQINRIKIVVVCVMVAVILALCIFSIFFPAETWQYGVGLPNVGKRKAGEMRIHFLDVGQGDATIIELPDGRLRCSTAETEERRRKRRCCVI